MSRCVRISINEGVVEMYLAGDIGGTKTLLALFEKNGTRLKLLKERKSASTKWNNLAEELHSFLKWAGVKPEEITSGCLSLAGPVQFNACHLTNLNRTLDLDSLRSSCHFQSPLLFCNDLVATGHGLSTLDPKDLLCLNPSALSSCSTLTAELNRAVIAPGTGLGEAIIIGGSLVCPTEGAHVDFAPHSELEVRLWRFLSKEYGHVSYERVLSGPGLVNIYRFLRTELIYGADNYSATPSPAEITERALAGTCHLSSETLGLFVQLLGAEAGNLALKSLALGGVYLGGGIPPKILLKLQGGSFLEAFQAKGRFRELLQNIPVYVILNERTALYGAASIAIRG